MILYHSLNYFKYVFFNYEDNFDEILTAFREHFLCILTKIELTSNNHKQVIVNNPHTWNNKSQMEALHVEQHTCLT
jgi:hypothetical protein